MKTKSEKFPLNIRNGSSVVKIYRDKTKASGVYYRVSFYKGGKRCGLNFTDLTEAKAEADAKAKQLSRGDLEALHITGKDRHIYGRALEILRPFNIALDSAVLEYAEARKALNGISLIDAVNFYMRHHGRGITRKSVADAVDEMIEAKKANGLSQLYIADIGYRLGALKESFRCDLCTLTPEDVRTFLGSLKLSHRSFNNYHSTLKTFLTFAKARNWLSKESDLLASIDKRKEKAAPVEIFQPGQMAALLNNATPELAACLALAAFAGLRSEEIVRLEWPDIERRPGFIEIAAHKAKTAARRLVPITPNLASWLAIAPRNKTLVWPGTRRWFFTATTRLAVKAKVPWKHNALRHSFISYRLAEIQDVNRVALEAGNSPQMIFKHYRELCTPAVAQTWFAIAPKETADPQ
jgi:integrase